MKSIVTFLALQSTDIINGDAVSFFLFDFLVILFVEAIEFVALSFIVVEINLAFAVAVHAPAHAEFRKLVNFAHLGDFTMAGLALNLACACVLRVAEEYVVGQAVYFNPFDGFARVTVFFLRRIPSGCCVELFDFFCSVHLCSVFANQLVGTLVLIDGHVAVHTNVHGRNVGMFAFESAAVAV